MPNHTAYFQSCPNIKVYLTELLVVWLVDKYGSQLFGLPNRGWRLASLPVCAATCRVTALSLSPCENRSSQSRDTFLFFISLHFFFLFFHYLQSPSLCLLACPCFFAPQTVLSIVFFYIICCRHLSSSVSNPAQSLWSFPKVSQKILPIFPHCYMVPSGSALPCLRRQGEIASPPGPFVLRVLPAIVL